MPEEVKELKTKLTLDVKDFSAGTQTAADDAESLKKEIEDLKEQIRKLGPEAKKSGQETESALNQVVKKFLGFAAVAAVIKSSWQNIQTLDRSLLQLRSNLGASSQEVEDFAESFSKLSSMSKSTLLSLSADFTTTLRSIFNDQNTMAKLTERVMKQVENISTSTGRSADEILSKYQQLLTGSYTAFEDFGIHTREEILKTSKTFQEFANGRAWNTLTDREKEQIALIETMRQVDEKFEQNTDSLTYKMGQMSKSWDNFTTSLGSLLYVAEPILTFFGNLFSMMSTGVDALNDVGGGFALVVIAGSAFVMFAPSIIKVLTTLFTGAVTTATAFAMLGASILMFTMLIASSIKNFNDERKQVEEETEAIKEQTEATEELHKARSGLMGIDEINTMQQQGDLIVNEDGTVEVDKRSDMLEQYMELQEKARENENLFAEALEESTSQMDKSMKTMEDTMAIITGMTFAYSAITLAIRAYNAIKKKKTIQEQEDTAASVENTAATEANEAATKQEAAADTQETGAQQAKNTAESQGAAVAAQSAAASGAAAAAAHTEAAAETGAAAAHAAKNTAASWGTWAAIGIPLIIGVIGTITALASRTQLAHGGVVGSETVATIGEGQYHEAVVPLGNSPEWKQTKEDLADYLSQRGGNSSGTTKMEAIVNLNGREMARAMAEDMHDEWRRRNWI